MYKIALALTIILVGGVSFALQMHISSIQRQERNSSYMQGSMNTIYYFRHRHHEPTYSWLVVSGEHGPIEDTEKEVSDLEIKAQAWEVDHNVDRQR